MADEPNLLDQIRKVVREEVEAEAKITRQKNTWQYAELSQNIDKIADRVKNVEVSNARLETGQQEIKTIQQEQGKKTDILLDGQSHIMTVLETLDERTQATKEEVVEIKKRQRPRHAD